MTRLCLVCSRTINRNDLGASFATDSVGLETLAVVDVVNLDLLVLQDTESQIDKERSRPLIDDVKLMELKRKKLQIKDEINRLNGTSIN